MSKQTTSMSDKAYLDAYFIERRKKEICRLIIGIFALVLGIATAGFSGEIAALVNESESLNLSENLISIFGLIINVCGFVILKAWVLDGKDYVFPRKQPNQVSKESI